MNLTEFLVARIAEDEAGARADLSLEQTGHTCWDCGDVAAANYVPAQALAECEAKRRIVELHSPVDPCDAHNANFETVPCDTLRALTLPYADHPDFDDSWRP